MESNDYLRILRRRWKVVVAAGILAVLTILTLAPASLLGTTRTSYTATATLVQEPGAQPLIGPAAERPLLFAALLVTTGPVPGAAAQRLGFDGNPATLLRSVSVSPDATSGALDISATSADPDRAELLADTFAAETVDEVYARAQRGQTIPIQLLQSSSAVPTEAGLLEGPTSRVGRLVLGLVVGLILGAALALLLERFDTSVRDRTDAQRAYRLPVLTEIPRLPYAARNRRDVIVKTAPASEAAEAFRSLRSSVLLMPSRRLLPPDMGEGLVDVVSERARPQVMLVTSARSGEGKTTIAVNLAAALAAGGQRVLFMDSDFRRPEAHRFLDVPNGPGLSDLIHAEEGAHELNALSRPTAFGNVRLVTAGTMTDQPPALPTRIAALIREARQLAECVIVDSPPMLLGNEAMDLMPYVDTVLVTCRSGRLTREQAERASELLARMRVPVAGLAFIGWRSSSTHLSQLLSLRSPGGESSDRRRRGAKVAVGESSS
jgi:Mrp family chromosome partitioning ATPase